MALTKIPPSGINTQALDEVLDISIANLTEVDFTVAPTNGQALVYDSTTDTWKAGTISGSSGGGGGNPGQSLLLSLIFR